MNVRIMRRTVLLPLLILTAVSLVWSFGDDDHLSLNVNGMHCQSCVSMIRKTVRKVPGVESVSIDLEKGLVSVECDSADVRRVMISEAIEKMGYDVVSGDSLNHAPADSAHVIDH